MRFPLASGPCHRYIKVDLSKSLSLPVSHTDLIVTQLGVFVQRRRQVSTGPLFAT